MKLLQNILSILLVTAFFNVVIAKSLHEFFEHGHEHELQFCEHQGLDHFHQHEFKDLDFICSFNFSTSFLDHVTFDLGHVIRFQTNKIRVHFLWLAKNLCARSISLRGPPNIS